MRESRHKCTLLIIHGHSYKAPYSYPTMHPSFNSNTSLPSPLLSNVYITKVRSLSLLLLIYKFVSTTMLTSSKTHCHL
ncbi:hypothetical protein FNV43_RR20152 [Rhamnella rubrinervis]|uniref:Uncharacterized protein n=1 Tax=Rhamnella rubrinervis TaxID=2594499 RepID=A0A8K0E045_9ROSA|nr:hypothetical protein FNV43_RR20152 [Rhamnella rubrinervis]